MKLKLTYIRIPKGTVGCIPQSHYDLHTVEKQPSNVACILARGEGLELIRKWVKEHNKLMEGEDEQTRSNLNN